MNFIVYLQIINIVLQKIEFENKVTKNTPRIRCGVFGLCSLFGFECVQFFVCEFFEQSERRIKHQAVVDVLKNND